MLRDVLIKTGKNHLKPDPQQSRKTWMTKEIIALISQRRTLKNKPKEYKKIQRVIQKRIREAKELWLVEQCKEIETYEMKHDSFNVHKKVKDMVRIRKKSNNNTLINNNGQLATNIKDKLSI